MSYLASLLGIITSLAAWWMFLYPLRILLIKLHLIVPDKYVWHAKIAFVSLISFIFLGNFVTIFQILPFSSLPYYFASTLLLVTIAPAYLLILFITAMSVVFATFAPGVGKPTACWSIFERSLSPNRLVAKERATLVLDFVPVEADWPQSGNNIAIAIESPEDLNGVPTVYVEPKSGNAEFKVERISDKISAKGYGYYLHGIPLNRAHPGQTTLLIEPQRSGKITLLINFFYHSEMVGKFSKEYDVKEMWLGLIPIRRTAATVFAVAVFILSTAFGSSITIARAFGLIH